MGQRITSISASGQSALAALTNRSWVAVQNVGTVALEVYLNADGSGDPDVILAAGAANDDGTGGYWADQYHRGAVWVKAPDGGGRALVSSKGA